jgi:hypothetical protein
MPARPWLARALGIAGVSLLVGEAGAGASAQPPPASPEQAALSCSEPAGPRQCVERCMPANLFFLPCMAVGAKAMAACREREVAWCLEACRRRSC